MVTSSWWCLVFSSYNSTRWWCVKQLRNRRICIHLHKTKKATLLYVSYFYTRLCHPLLFFYEKGVAVIRVIVIIITYYWMLLCADVNSKAICTCRMPVFLYTQRYTRMTAKCCTPYTQLPQNVLNLLIANLWTNIGGAHSSSRTKIHTHKNRKYLYICIWITMQQCKIKASICCELRHVLVETGAKCPYVAWSHALQHLTAFWWHIW